MLLLSFETFVALRHLRSRKRSRVLSTLTMISILGVVLGVWALTVVLSVLSGFGGDLRKKILESTPNIVVEHQDGELGRPLELCKKVAQIPGVLGCSPYIMNEVMISSGTNSSGVLLRGIDRASLRSQIVEKQLRQGKLDYLFSPSLIPRAPTLSPYRSIDIFRESGADLTPEESRYLKLPDIRNLDPPTSRPLPPSKDRLHKETLPPSRSRPSPDGTPLDRLLQGLPSQGSPAPAPPPASSPQARPDERGEEKDKDDDLPAEVEKTTTSELPGLFLGQELAQTLSVVVGDVVRIVSPLGGSLTPMGPAPRVRKFRVAGFFFTGMYEYDTKFAYISLAASQMLFKMEGLVTGLEVQVRDPFETPTLKRALRAALGGGGFLVRDWIEMNGQLFGALRVEKIAMFIILTFIVLVASFNIVSTLIMVVLEKTSEIAILKSMGATKRSIMQIFMIEGVIIGVLGTILGLALGWRTCLHLIQYPIKMNTDVYYIATLPIRMNLSDFLAVAVAAILISFLATIYPARQAADLHPVEGLRNE